LRTTLRIELPRLTEVRPDVRVAFALADEQRVLRSGELALRDVGATVPGADMVAILHPADAMLAEVSVPALPAHRMAAVVASAIEPLTLADPDTLAVGHGPRNAQGRMTLAWADQAPLATAWEALADNGFYAEALVPAPLAIPLVADGVTLMLREHTLLARLGRDQGHALVLDPLAQEDDPGEAVIVWLTLLLRQHPDMSVTWVSRVPPWFGRVIARLEADESLDWRADGDDTPRTRSQTLAPETRWSATLPAWSLALAALRPRNMQRSAWRRPLGLATAAAAIWLIGLNINAHQLGAEETRLRQHMSQQVRTAFPEIPVVLDPLRQATQQRDALRTSVGDSADSDFVPLALAAASLLPAAANNVVSVEFADDTLTLRLGDSDVEPTGALDPAVAQRAHALGLQVDYANNSWVVQRQNDGVRDTEMAARGMTIRPGAATSQQMNRINGGNS